MPQNLPEHKLLTCKMRINSEERFKDAVRCPLKAGSSGGTRACSVSVNAVKGEAVRDTVFGGKGV